jgi:Ca-activated chloride channel family protein
MRKAAEIGRGSYTMISALSDVGEKMDELFEKISEPQVTGISVDWPGGVGVDAYPQAVPDLYANEPVVVKAKISGVLQATDVIGIRGDTPAGAWQRELTVLDGRQSSGVAALWARSRIEALSDAATRGRDAAAVRKDIVATALKYHLVSRHTSLVAVEKIADRQPGAQLRRDVVPNLMAYGQNSQAIFGLPATGTNALQLQLAGGACLLLASLIIAVRRRRRDRSGALAR